MAARYADPRQVDVDAPRLIPSATSRLGGPELAAAALFPFAAAHDLMVQLAARHPGWQTAWFKTLDRRYAVIVSTLPDTPGARWQHHYVAVEEKA